MRMEHIAYSVEDPAKVAQWYVKNLGMKVVRKMDDRPWMHFLADASGSILIELYNNAKVKVPDYRGMDPLLLHLAFSAADITKDRDRLIAAGATVADDLVTTPAGDQLVMLRDPWGLAIQLTKRVKPML
ncbi:MAG: VOC family protein [Planctomycetes bacterium]|nr:VOC family protein [Planctomycetota bacterium]